jgi:outer membrane protein insertion porin family
MPKIQFHYLAALLLSLVLAVSATPIQAQQISAGAMKPSKPVEYTIGGITVSGAQYLDAELVAAASGLTIGDKIRPDYDPSISRAIKTLWKQQLFSDVAINITKIENNKAYLDIAIKERPRLSQVVFVGINKTQETEIKDKLNIVQNRMVTESMKKDIEVRVKKYFEEKGFVAATTRIHERRDTNAINQIALMVYIDKGKKVHINQIMFAGNENVTATKLKSRLKDTKEMPRLSLHAADNYSIYGTERTTFKEYVKEKGFLSLSRTLEALNPYFRWNIFAGSKFNPQKYKADKENILEHYNNLGYRDAQIIEDTTYMTSNGNINIEMKLKEGKKYYFGDFEWRGNTKYSDSILSLLLNIKKGDIYDQQLLDSRLGSQASPDGSQDIGSLYMDDGYLFFRVTPMEKSIVGDTINYEIVIQEGPQATIKNVGIFGNDKTNDYVLRREIFTRPGYKFSRADIIRSIRQLSNLGFIDPEKVRPEPKPNPSDGTVDIDYHVAEKSSDQLELSAGFGGSIGFMGTIGIVFNNFSLRNIFNVKDWDPLPMGDGQKLSLRYQSSGKYYNTANFSFTEPWLGGKKPISLTLNGTYGKYTTALASATNLGSSITFMGGGLSISRRLRWPDDNFVISVGLNYMRYNLHNYNGFGVSDFTYGSANNLSLKLTLARNTIDQPIYPRSGSNINFSAQLTPPYSLFNDIDYSDRSAATKYKWVELHKYRFNAEWYQRIAGDLVFKFAAKYGFVGYYNKDIGFSPFERFNVGGDGLSGFNMFVGRDIISHRGYDVYTSDAVIFNKYTAEIRYPLSLNPSATIFGLAFVEAGNGWKDYKDYNPFKLYRSAGLGVRVYLPMFGLLGLDYGLGFDRLGNGTGFGGAAKFTFMLGFEPE